MKYLVALMLFCMPAFGAGAPVQSVRCAGSGGATSTCQFTTSNNTTGNLLTWFLFWRLTAQTNVVTDGAGNAYTARTQLTGTGEAMQEYDAPITVGGGTKITATVTTSGGTDASLDIIGVESSGVATSTYFDTSNSSFTGSATSPQTSAAITTTNANDYVISCFGNTAANYTAITSPFTSIIINNAGQWAKVCGYNNYTSTQSGLTTTASSGTADTSNYTVAFKQPGGGGGVKRMRGVVIQQ